MGVKAGTRCECRGDHIHPETSQGYCYRDAVRLVTVVLGREARPEDEDDTDTMSPMQVGVDVPMCGPCADWHEGKAGAR